MEDDRIKRRPVGTVDVVKPLPANPIISQLATYGVQPSQIIGRNYKADALAGEKFKDYEIVMFGVVRNDERLPITRLFWDDREGGYYCWQFQIYWRQNYNAYVDARWREEYENYQVVTVWGSLGQLDKQTENALNKGLKLLLVIAERMTERGRPKGTGWFRNVDEFRTALKEELQSCQKRPTQLQVLKMLDEHYLCQLRPKKPRIQSDTKLLRSWIRDARLGDFNKALEMYNMAVR